MKLQSIFDDLRGKLKDFLKSQVVAKLDELVAKSPNKIDDFAWAQVRGGLVAWIDAL